MMMKHFWKAPLALAVFGFAFALAGCNGSGSPAGAPTFTVTFDSGSGSGSPVAPQRVREGDSVIRPIDPVGVPSAGLWYDVPDFDGWFDEDGELWNFDTVITGDITLTASWYGEPAQNAGVTANSVPAAVAHVSNPANTGSFTLAINQNVNSGTQTLDHPDTDLVIICIGGPQRITLTGSGDRLFYVGPASGTIDSISLTLGNDIIIMGRGQGPDFIRVRNGGRLYMEANARITGHTTTNGGPANGAGAAVFVEHNSTLTMRDNAEITGNRANNEGGITDGNTAGGVFLRRATSNLVMEGGSITGNFRGENTPADVVFVGNDVPAELGAYLEAIANDAGDDRIGVVVRR